MTSKFLFLFASVSGFLSVALGAFGAHGLKEKLESTGRLETFNTAVHYQFFHTIILFVIGILLLKFDSSMLRYSGVAMMVGILIFSGSLFLLCFTGIKWLGAITPIGGLLFLAGWSLLFLGVLKVL